MTWDILIPSLNARHGMLDELLDILLPQITPVVRVLVCQDNGQLAAAAKCNRLTETSNAEYISFIDDDDLVSADYVARITYALWQKPDYVGFRVRYTADGAPQVPVVHSLQYPGPWKNTDEGNFRDIQQFNPIRRELALLAPWKGGYDADRMRADRLREMGVVKFEVFVDAELYHYRYRSDLTYSPDIRNTLTTDVTPPRRSEEWLTWI